MKKLVFVWLLYIILSGPLFGQTEADLAIEMYRKGDYAEVVRLLEALRDRDQIDYRSASYLGGAYIKTGREKEAAEVFRKLPSYKPTKAQVTYDRKLKIINRPRAGCGSSGNSSASLAVELDRTGKIGFVFPFSYDSVRFRDSVSEAARRIQFEPRMLKGEPITSIVVFEYNCQV